MSLYILICSKYNPYITEFLKTLQFIQKKWITPPETDDNHWEFQPIFYNPNINFKTLSKGRKYIIPEDFGFKPDSYLLSLKLTDICNKGKFESNTERLKKVICPQYGKKYLTISVMQKHIKTLLKNPNKFPSLSTQDVPKEGYYFEELSNLFYVIKKGGKNYREALKMIKKDQKIEKSRFDCRNIEKDDVLEARKALH